jgi:hypothetical protein
MIQPNLGKKMAELRKAKGFAGHGRSLTNENPTKCKEHKFSA